MPAYPPLPDPFYYLNNFQFVLDWVRARYPDLLSPDDHRFIEAFGKLQRTGQALFVRMVMRKGERFRLDKLRYLEIGDPAEPIAALVSLGWVEADPPVGLDDLFRLHLKAELWPCFRLELEEARLERAGKQVQLAHLLARFPHPLPVSQWFKGAAPSAVYQFRLTDMCDRFRLMFFGNLRQDWVDFILAELGMFVYEKVDFSMSSRAFQSRADIDAYLNLHRCAQHFDLEPDASRLDVAIDAIPVSPYANPWLEGRRARLLFKAGQHYERQQRWQEAACCYERSPLAGARARLARVLERQEQYELAVQVARDALATSTDEAEVQQLERMLPRLLRHCGLPTERSRPISAGDRLDLTLDSGPTPSRVEGQVLHHLHREEAPVFYVENTLINALFGLLCWDVVFAPLPAAFFHPFQSGPADLLRPDFHVRRADRFDTCLAQLYDGRYQDAIRATYRAKSGIQCSFVVWQALTTELIELALSCIPPQHLHAMFSRLLKDVRTNRSGLPDLIQFWPAEKRYRMIEVKGPGDRLQDNQRRWIAYCEALNIPISVCYVRRPEP